MRISILMGILLFAFYVSISIRNCVLQSRILAVCNDICDRRGRELSSAIGGSFVVECNCGEKKKIKSMGQP